MTNRRSTNAPLLAIAWPLLGLVVAACAESTTPSFGGETNWLMTCEQHDECAGSCLCGVCTKACNERSDCADAFAGECTSGRSRAATSACRDAREVPPAALCLPTCRNDAQCGASFACREGVCVTDAAAMRFDQAPGSDAGAVDASDPPEPVACRQSGTPPSCTLEQPCTWQEAQALTTHCVAPPMTPFYAVRCGAYDALVVQGIDSSRYRYYDESGALVGTNEIGLGGVGCVSYEPSFTTVPASCEAPPAGCVPDVDACDCDSAELALECVCALNTCHSFAYEVATAACGFPSMPATIRRGCGYAIVFGSNGLASRTLAYEGADNTLVGAAFTDDVGGHCGTSIHSTAIPDLVDCADYSICELCETGMYPTCEL